MAKHLAYFNKRPGLHLLLAISNKEDQKTEEKKQLDTRKRKIENFDYNFSELGC